MRFDVGLSLSGQGRWVESSRSPHIKEKGIPTLHTLLAFTEMNRIIKRVAFVRLSANEDVVLCAASSSHFLYLRTWQQNILLGHVLFISGTPLFHFPWFSSHLDVIFLRCSDAVWWHNPESFPQSLLTEIKSATLPSVHADSDQAFYQCIKFTFPTTA